MRLSALAVLLALVVSPEASQPSVGEWAQPVSLALAERLGGRGEELVLDRVERLDLPMADGSQLVLLWSSDAQKFLNALREIEKQNPTEGEGYDVATGLNRFTQIRADGTFAAGEHWADTTGSYRLALFISPSKNSALNWLIAFDTFRRAGGFGGWPLTTPPLTAP